VFGPFKEVWIGHSHHKGFYGQVVLHRTSY
jgi:hypothetical protein